MIVCRSADSRLGGALALAALLCGVPSIASAEASDPVEPVACGAPLKTPKLRATIPSVVPEPIWSRKEEWEASVRFRLDDTGVPSRVVVSVKGEHPDAPQLEEITAQALRGYRFCLPTDYSSSTDWLATVRFVHRHVKAKSREGDMYIQMFVPTYTRADIAGRREGTARVVATFGPEGRPAQVHLTASSGDPVLDDKSIDAVSTYQLTFHEDTAQMFPLTFEHPITYKIR